MFPQQTMPRPVCQAPSDWDAALTWQHGLRKTAYASTLVAHDIISLPLQSSMAHPSFASGDAANSYALPPRQPPRPVSNAPGSHSQPHSQNPEGTHPASTNTLLTARQASGAALRRPRSAAPAVSMTSSALVPGSVQQAGTGPGSSGSEQEGDWQPLGEGLTAAGGKYGYPIWHMNLGKPTREAVFFMAPQWASRALPDRRAAGSTCSLSCPTAHSSTGCQMFCGTWTGSVAEACPGSTACSSKGMTFELLACAHAGSGAGRAGRQGRSRTSKKDSVQPHQVSRDFGSLEPALPSRD